MAIFNSELLNYQKENTSGPFRVKQTHRCCLIACLCATEQQRTRTQTHA